MFVLRRIFFLFLLFVSYAFANTEIVNFDASEQINARITNEDEWPTINPSTNQTVFTVTPAPLGTHMNAVCASPQDLLSKTPNCVHEVWIKLDLDESEWKRYRKFTLRVSWPGSSPADFGISILNPEATASRFAGSLAVPPAPAMTRVKFARIRVVDTGVISPMSGLLEVRPVSFIVTVEPLYLGLIPASLIPFLWTLIPVVLVAALMVPYIHTYLQKVAERAKSEKVGKKD
ncbi:hypothetical protein BDP27DRAFT_1448144 [Rhodocollybia butyracea]|uniref:Uncharacterized protein n=1 Tax=Rhodocollybia butyracea TaxID=206335 RepID=A0A9P5U786_9AGAR|nr:hypothetical protein BDP27DRAFT_1448144 [Rhodocollybia butyracea]